MSFVFMRYIDSKSKARLEKNITSSAPSVKAVRSGKFFTVSSDDIVPGDLVFLQKGDIAFFDARLIHTKDLFVLEKHVCGGDGLKNADFESYVPELPKKDQKNMIFSRSVVSRGYAYGVVCTVDTSFSTGGFDPGNLKLIRHTERISRIFGIFLLLYTVVFTLLSLIFSGIGEQFNAVNAFTTALCSVCASFFEYYTTLAFCAIADASYTRSDTKKDREAAVQNIPSLSKIKNISLLAFDKISSLCPDAPYIEKIYTKGKEYDPNKDSIETFKETIYTAALSTDNDPFSSPFNQAVEKLLNRMHLSLTVINNLYPLRKRMKAEGLSLFNCSIVDHHGKNMLCCRGSARNVLHRCSHVLTASGTAELTREDILSLLSVASDYEQNGYRLIACASEYADTFDKIHSLRFDGFLIIPQKAPDAVFAAVSDLLASDIKLLLFCDDISESNYRLAKQLGIVTSENQVLSSFELNSKNLNILKLQLGNYRLFQGLSTKEKKYVLDHLRRNNGERIGVLTTEFEDTSYADGGKYILFCVDRGSKNYKGAQALKHLCDVFVPNISDGGGIICASKLLNSARSLFSRCLNMLGYLLFSAFSLLILSCMSVFGIFSLSGSQIMFCSLLSALPQALLLLFSKAKDMTASPSYLSNKRILHILISSAICSLTAFISLLLLFASGKDITQCSDIAFYSLIFTLTAAYLITTYRNRSLNEKKEWRVAIPSVCIILLPILLSFISNELMRKLGLGVFSFTDLLYMLPPSLALIIFDLIRRIKLKKF